MDLICPSCQKRLTIEDRFAGTVVKCPLCGSMLQAPVLLNAPAPPLPEAPGAASPTPAPATMPELTLGPPASAPPPPAAPPPAPPVLDVAEVVPPAAETAPLRPGEYSRSFRCHLRPDILEWITPACCAAIFVLSLFSWYAREIESFNLWQLAFTAGGHSIYTFYVVVFMFVAMPASVAVLIVEKNWVPYHEALRQVWPYRSLIVGGLATLPFLFLLADYVQFQFLPVGVRMTIAMKLAFRLHLLAIVACGLQFWLNTRRARLAPLPRLTIRW